MTDIFEFALAVFRYGTPVFLAALGVLLCQKSGITNIGAEGFMLLGALFGITGAGLFGSYIAGFLMAIVITSVFGLIFGQIVYILKVNDIVLGMAFNIFAAGLSALLYRSGVGSVRYDSKNLSMNGLFVLALAAAVLMHLFLYHSAWGLKLRTVGEYEHISKALGLGGRGLRLIAFIAGCALIGLGGATLSLGQLNMFVENMTNGRGYIALAAVCFGRFTPAGTLFSVLIFGIGEAAVYRFQAAGVGIPHQFAQMIPYILTLLGLVVAGKGKERMRNV